jgi:hypothetical protein
MTEQCFGRKQKDGESHRGRFQNKNRFFLEYRCEGNVSQDQLCAKCLGWKERGLKKNDHYRSHHGLITEPIPEWSHIFEGPWYQSKVGIYGHPSSEEMARAKEAQQIARKGIETVPPVEAIKPVLHQDAPKKRGGRKKKDTPVPVPPPEPEPTPPSPPQPPEPKPKAPGKRRLKKTVNAVIVPQAPVVQVQAVEMGQPIEVEIVRIVVKPFFANDTMYFRDASKNKLYSVGKDKNPSTYVGRWDPEAETIDREFPDSDLD